VNGVAQTVTWTKNTIIKFFIPSLGFCFLL
jgi:hypothetical protein